MNDIAILKPNVSNFFLAANFTTFVFCQIARIGCANRCIVTYCTDIIVIVLWHVSIGDYLLVRNLRLLLPIVFEEFALGSP